MGEKTKTYDIINASDYNLCILNLETCFNELVIIKKLLNLLDDNNETKIKKHVMKLYQNYKK